MFSWLINAVLLTIQWLTGLLNKSQNRVTADLNVLSFYGKNECQLWDFSQYEKNHIVNLMWQSPDFKLCELLPEKNTFTKYKNVKLCYRSDKGWVITDF